MLIGLALLVVEAITAVIVRKKTRKSE